MPPIVSPTFRVSLWWTHRWVVQKRMNRSRYQLDVDSRELRGPLVIRRGPRSPKDRDILGETSACADVSAIDWRLIYSTYTQCYSQGGGSDAALTTITVSTCCIYRRRVSSQRLREPEVAPHNRQWRHWQLVLVDTCPCTTSQRQSAQSHTHTSRRTFAPGPLPPPKKKTTIVDICFPD